MQNFFTTTKALQLFQLMRQGSLILTSVLLAKSGLTTGEIGHYEALLYLGTALTFFWVNGLLQSIVPLHARKPEPERKALIFNVFLMFCGFSVLLAALFFSGEEIFVPLLTGLPKLPAFGAFCLFLLFNLPTFPVEYFYLLQNKPFQIAAWGLLSFGLQMLFLLVPLWLGWGLEAGVWGMTLLAFLRFSWTAILVLRTGAAVFRKDLTKEILAFSAPLMSSSMVGNLIVVFDFWLVGWWFQDSETFAVFRYGARELPLALPFFTALGVSITPRLAEDLPGGLAILKSMSRKLFHLVFPAVIVLVLFVKPLFPLVFNPDFEKSAPVFAIFLLLTASRVLLPNSILLALGQPKIIFRVSVLELLLKVVFGFMFLKLWGLTGLAWSAVLCFWFEKIALLWVLERRLDVRTADWLDLRWYFGYLVGLLLAFFIAG